MKRISPVAYQLFLYLFALCAPFVSLFSQNVGIGTTAPHASALLDISSSSRGLLVPRMSADQRNAIGNPATGLLVYVNTDSSFYYRQGQSWKKITGEGDNWLVNGNGNATGRFLGTLDTSAIRFRTRNLQRMVLDSNGRIGMNTSSPATFIHLVDDGRYLSDITMEYNNSFNAYPEVLFKRSGGTASQKTATPVNTTIGQLGFYGNLDGKGWAVGSAIRSQSAGDFLTVANVKSTLEFFTREGNSYASRIFIAPDGRVGFNTSRATFPVTIKSHPQFADLMSFQRAKDSTDRWHLKLAGADTTDLNFVESGVEENRLYLAAGGNVGIGTGKPLERLQVSDFNQYANTYLSLKTPGGNQYKAAIRFRHFNDQVGYDLESDDQVNAFYLKHWAGTATPSPILSVSAAENVGIGLATPELKLDVQGSVGIRNAAPWDHIKLAHDGTVAMISAGGAELGFALRVGTSGGSYADASYNEVMRLLPNGNVGIGTASPNNSAILHLASTTKGLLIPQMTSANRDAIGNPATGLLIFQTNNNPGFYYQTGSGWAQLATTSSTTKIITGFVDATYKLGTGYTLERLANNQYRVSWPAGSFPVYAFADARSSAGAVVFASWAAGGDGSGSFTTVTNAPSQWWFTITELK